MDLQVLVQVDDELVVLAFDGKQRLFRGKWNRRQKQTDFGQAQLAYGRLSVGREFCEERAPKCIDASPGIEHPSLAVIVKRQLSTCRGSGREEQRLDRASLLQLLGGLNISPEEWTTDQKLRCEELARALFRACGKERAKALLSALVQFGRGLLVELRLDLGDPTPLRQQKSKDQEGQTAYVQAKHRGHCSEISSSPEDFGDAAMVPALAKDRALVLLPTTDAFGPFGDFLGFFLGTQRPHRRSSSPHFGIMDFGELFAEKFLIVFSAAIAEDFLGFPARFYRFVQLFENR